jgi:hypothetical protein
MNLTTGLCITHKGVDEVKRRVYKLDMKKRSLLILLKNPQTIESLLHKTVLPVAEFLAEIDTLVLDGFVALIGGSVSRSNEPDIAERVVPDQVTNSGIHLDDEIILSEAKFLLVDFSADSFETQSQAFVDEIIDGIYACKSVNDLRLRLTTIFAATEKLCPDRLQVLFELVKEINETA